MSLLNISGAEPLYTAVQTRELDRCAIEEHGVPGIILMSRAASACMVVLQGCWPDSECLRVLCGTGNNGGDGYLIADLAHKRGIVVQVYEVGDAAKTAGDARSARQQALANGVAIQPFTDTCLEGMSSGVVVDAMLGTGLGGQVRGPYRAAIEAINVGGLPVLAVDIPSGLCSDTGAVLGVAVRADVTVTFIGLKRGMFTGEAPDYTGVIHFTDLELPTEVYAQVPSTCSRLDMEPLLACLPERPSVSHKGKFGSVLIIGGDRGMAGAVAMAAEAALRCGVGLVRVATHAEHLAALIARTPEAMVHPVKVAAEMAPLIEQSDVLVVGPGLGRSPWSEQLLQAALASGKPMVLDADGLNLLAGSGDSSQRRDNWVLTPHPGEAARLLAVSTEEIQADRFASAQQLQQKFGGIVVLKGNGSLIASGAQILLSDYGNPGMASGGMGDVLSGVLGALLAQSGAHGLSALESAALAVVLHGEAADRAAEQGQRGLCATDLIPGIRALLG